MALHRKWSALLSLSPDIAILPEAAAPDILHEKGVDLSSVSTCWRAKSGANTRQKGLLVAAFGDYAVEPVASASPDLDIFLPVAISGPIIFKMLAVWSFNHRTPGTKNPTALALNQYESILLEGGLVGGDFNNNPYWDKAGRETNFADVLRHLKEFSYRSVYHDALDEEPGRESRATIYWRERKEFGPRYHIDYMFESASWRLARTRFSMGSYDEWVASGLSDHVPLVCDWDNVVLSGATDAINRPLRPASQARRPFPAVALR